MTTAESGISDINGKWEIGFDGKKFIAGKDDNSPVILRVYKDDADFNQLTFSADNITLGEYNSNVWSDISIFKSSAVLFDTPKDLNSFYAVIGFVNGWDSRLTNAPDKAKNRFSIVLSFTLNGIAEIGNGSATRIQVLITNGNGIFTRKYENGTWSEWV